VLLVISKYRSPHSFKNIKQPPAKYDASTNSWTTTVIFEDCLKEADTKIDAKSTKSVLFIDQYAAHSKDTTLLKQIKLLSPS
jgi:hypothetical protein